MRNQWNSFCIMRMFNNLLSDTQNWYGFGHLGCLCILMMSCMNIATERMHLPALWNFPYKGLQSAHCLSTQILFAPSVGSNQTSTYVLYGNFEHSSKDPNNSLVKQFIVSLWINLFAVHILCQNFKRVCIFYCLIRYYITNVEFLETLCYGEIKSFFKLWLRDKIRGVVNALNIGRTLINTGLSSWHQ